MSMWYVPLYIGVIHFVYTRHCYDDLTVTPDVDNDFDCVLSWPSSDNLNTFKCIILLTLVALISAPPPPSHQVTLPSSVM